MGCCDCRDSALRLTIFTPHRTPFEALRRSTLDIIADVEGQHGTHGNVVLKRFLCSLLKGDDTFQLVPLVDVRHVSNVSDFEWGVLGPTYLLDLIEHLH